MNYKIIYSTRRTITITVERDRSVVVRAPEGTHADRINEIVERKRHWVFQKQRHSQKYSKGRRLKEFVSGESVLYLGRSYRLEIVEASKPSVNLRGKFIVCGASKADSRDCFRTWFIERAKEVLPPRADKMARNIGVSFRRLMISDLRYRWGSCTPRDRLNINWRLVKAPMLVVDYVIAHELAHLVESNHTPRFWNVVRAQVPHYQKAKDWLRLNGEILEWDF